MALVCRECSRINPPEAAYCYEDGAPLPGAISRSINIGAAAFAKPFVFPDGPTCRSFDELAKGCQDNWRAALALLDQGVFASFFGDLGRDDLAVAAHEAAAVPDRERGLDYLLEKLPSRVLVPPRLRVEPTAFHLGRLTVGGERKLELRITNHGKRLLYGSIASSVNWLAFGDAPGQPQKVFQFCDSTAIAVQVRGQHVRASFQPLEAQLVVDSNGGAATIEVRAEVPVVPFAGGLFAGALTPRQIAEKAQANPAEAARYVEDGRVAAWYEANGWTYPVTGPAMPGLGALQQMFEALGVATPPVVHVNPASYQFSGFPQESFAVDLVLSSAEDKVVYGAGTSDQPWVAVGKTALIGRTAVIPLTVTLPSGKGNHVAHVTVLANGQQRFIIPVTVAVVGGADIGHAEHMQARSIPSASLPDGSPIPVAILLPPIPRPEPVPLSWVAMIVGIVSVGFGLFALAPLAGIGGVIAVVLGIIAKRRGAKWRGGEGQAIAGILLGLAAIVMGFLWMSCGLFGLFTVVAK